MNRVVIFSEIMSEKACRAAEDFLDQGDTVYALVGEEDGNQKVPQKIKTLAVNRTSPASIRQAAETIVEETIDLLVLSNGVHGETDGTIREHHSMQEMEHVMDQNLTSNYYLTEAVLPKMKQGGMKRIAVLTEKKASNYATEERTDFAYAMIAASTNMLQRVLFNRLRPEGFTFRNFADDGEKGGMCAADYFLSNLCDDPNDAYIHSDENRLVMRNAYLKEIPW